MVNVLSVKTEAIPQELRAIDQWVAWRGEPAITAEGIEKLDKIPVNPHSGGAGSTTNPATWGTFLQGLDAYHTRSLSGIGLVLTEGTGIVGVDVDKCRNPETGEINAEGLGIIRRLKSYTEVSPSGTGIRIFIRGNLPPYGRKKGRIEMYVTGRFLTVTGHEILDEDGEGRDVEDRTAEILALHLEVFGQQVIQVPHAGSNGNGSKRPADELSRLLEELTASDSRLLETWERRREEFEGDQSRYDQALVDALVKAGWSDSDIRFAVGAHRQMHGEDTEKVWKRKDYIERTIRKARSSQPEAYEGLDDSSQLAEEADSIAPRPFELNDVANGKRLVHWHGRNLRYCHEWKRWIVWDGARWANDKTGAAARLAKDAQRRIWQEIALVEGSTKEDDERRQAIAKHAARSASARAIGDMLKMAGSEPVVPVLPEEFDADPWLLNIENGTVDLRTGSLGDHRRGDLLSKIASVRYEEGADCPIWKAFLWRIMGGEKDPERAERLIGFLRRAAGYCLTAKFSEKALFVAYGSGDNGKSTFLNALRDMLGDYAKQAAPDLLIAKKHESHPTEIADLAGSRFISSIETEQGKRLAESLVKWLSGGDKIKGRFMGENFFEFDPTFKMWLATNHLPNVRGTDAAIWKRIKLIPFEEHIPESEQDKGLADKLSAERPGILRWAIDGCLEWQQEGLGVPQEIAEATAHYRAEMDAVARFIEEECKVGPGHQITSAALYAAYSEWCTSSGERPLSKKQFGQQLAEHGKLRSEKKGGIMQWVGIGIFSTSISSAPEADPDGEQE